MIYKFTDTDYNINNSIYIDMYNYYKDGGAYDKDNPLENYSCTWDNGDIAYFNRLTPELLLNGYKKVMGWYIGFYDVWGKYLINLKYHGWTEVHAPSKMAIRDVLGNNNIIDKIIKL